MKGGYRIPWRSASLAAFSAALLLTACGGQRSTAHSVPKLPHALGVQLATKSDRVAGAADAGDWCAASADAKQLQNDTIRAINEGRVPAVLQEPLQSGVNELVTETDRCAPARGGGEEPGRHGHGRGKGKKRGKGKGAGEAGD